MLHEWFSRRLVRHPVSWLTTFAFVLLSKGDQPAENEPPTSHAEDVPAEDVLAASV